MKACVCARFVAKTIGCAKEYEEEEEEEGGLLSTDKKSGIHIIEVENKKVDRYTTT